MAASTVGSGNENGSYLQLRRGVGCNTMRSGVGHSGFRAQGAGLGFGFIQGLGLQIC